MYDKIFKVLVFLFIFQSMLHSEFVVVTKDKASGQFRPMTNAETLQYQDKISSVLLKYQWPMCIQSDLTPAEIAEYLAPNTPYAQEKFVQKKLQEAIGPDGADLHVMFAPDSFYQLFCIAEKTIDLGNDQYQEVLKKKICIF